MYLKPVRIQPPFSLFEATDRYRLGAPSQVLAAGDLAYLALPQKQPLGEVTSRWWLEVAVW